MQFQLFRPNPCSPPSGRESRWWDRAAVLIIGIGVALRVEAFLDRRPLWIDESRLALNVAARGLLDLARPLELDQAAPIPFLWASRAVVSVAGVNEFALRLVPLLAGVLLLVVLWRLARAVIGPPEALFVVTLASLSLLLVYYSSEFKQYLVDAAITVVVVAEGVRFLAAGASRSWWRLGIVGVVAVVCSQPAVFVLTGVVAALLADVEARARPSRLVAVLMTWAIVFGGLYLLSFGQTARDPGLQRFWEAAYLRPGHDFGTRLDHAGHSLFVLPLPLTPESPPVVGVAAVFLVGLAGLASGAGRQVGLLVGVPYVAVAAASMAGFYPIAYRLLLFLSPLTFLTIGGVVNLAGRGIGPRRRDLVLAGLCGAPFVLAAGPLAFYLIDPGPRWNLRSVIASLPPEGTVYVAASALPQWTFYTTDWRRPDEHRLERVFALARYGGVAHENAPPRGRAVVCEGDQLVLRHQGRVELIGLPTGIEFRQYAGYTRDLPDAGWAENEARRIRGTGDSTIWVLIAHSEPHLIAQLLSRLERTGGTIVEERIQNPWPARSARGIGYSERVAAYRVTFRKPPPADPCASARL